MGSGADLEPHDKAEINSPWQRPGIGAPQVSNWASLPSFRVQYRRQRSRASGHRTEQNDTQLVRRLRDQMPGAVG